MSIAKFVFNDKLSVTSSLLALSITFRSYTQGGISTTEFPAKSCTSNIYFPVNEVPKPGLRVTAVCALNGKYN